MFDFDRIRTVKRNAQRRLRGIPGVHAVGIGAKVTGGQRTKQPAIIVFVVQKKSPSEIRPEEMVPVEIDGVKTDVIQAEIPRLATGLPDQDSYRDSGLQGGIQIQVGQSIFGGTLGCIGATDSPDSVIVAITNEHVVSPETPVPSKSTLSFSLSKDRLAVTFTGTSSGNLQVAVDIMVVRSTGETRFVSEQYITTAGDTLANIALQVAGLINNDSSPDFTAAISNAEVSLGATQGVKVTFQNVVVNRLFGVVAPAHPRLNVTFMGTVDPGLLLFLRIATMTDVNGPVKTAEIYWVSTPSDTLASIATAIAQEINVLSGVPFTATATGGQVTITPKSNSAVEFVSCETFAARSPQPTAGLKADVTNQSITLSGRVSGDNYGMFINVNAGGFEPAHGTFVAPRRDTNLNDIASSIVLGLKNLNIPNVSFSAPGGARIDITGAEEVECLITSDIRVGQPNNNFPSACSDCTNSRIGKVLDARLDLDCAIVQLDPGMKYKNDVVEIGAVADVHDITPDEATSHTFHVQKRGRSTGHKVGIVQAIDVDGLISNDNSRTFQRYYAGAIQIHSTTNDPFSGEGDSGAAVLTMAREVAGILFGNRGADTVATPIAKIREEMEVIVQTATAAGKVLTVPKPTRPHVLPAIAPAPALAPRPEPIMRIRLRERLAETQSGIAATAAGRRYSTLIGFFAPEIRGLIDTNRRVAATWQQSGGPQLVQAVLGMLQGHDSGLPEEIDGRPLAACVGRIQKVLMRYASPGLAAALRVHAPRIARLGGLSYSQALAALGSPQTE
jgi:hypothetical protein